MVASVAWVVLWVLGIVGIDAATSNGAALSNPAAVFLLLISFYWGGTVAMNVAHVSVSGAVASWWFRPVRESIPRIIPEAQTCTCPIACAPHSLRCFC